jgi:hypothetical protein
MVLLVMVASVLQIAAEWWKGVQKLDMVRDVCHVCFIKFEYYIEDVLPIHCVEPSFQLFVFPW